MRVGEFPRRHRRLSLLRPVCYVERVGRHRWRSAEVTFCCRDEVLRRRWTASIREQLAAAGTCTPPLLTHESWSRLSRSLCLPPPPASRPRRLLVYINPYGGKRQGKRVYEHKVAPLFAQAGIHTHVIGRFWPVHFLFGGFAPICSAKT